MYLWLNYSDGVKQIPDFGHGCCRGCAWLSEDKETKVNSTQNRWKYLPLFHSSLFFLPSHRVYCFFFSCLPVNCQEVSGDGFSTSFLSKWLSAGVHSGSSTIDPES